MDSQVIFSPLALDDLEQIVTFVAQDDPAAAERLGCRLLESVETLCRFPHRGGEVRERPGVRKLVSCPYLIFYRVDAATRRVEILRFWHGARSPEHLRFQ